MPDHNWLGVAPSPRPWLLHGLRVTTGDTISTTVADCNVNRVAGLCPAGGPDHNGMRGAANARLIVKAVNAHDDLLAALECIVAAWESIPERDIVNEEMNLDGMWANARTAIEKAKGETQ